MSMPSNRSKKDLNSRQNSSVFDSQMSEKSSKSHRSAVTGVTRYIQMNSIGENSTDYYAGRTFSPMRTKASSPKKKISPNTNVNSESGVETTSYQSMAARRAMFGN